MSDKVSDAAANEAKIKAAMKRVADLLKANSGELKKVADRGAKIEKVEEEVGEMD